MYEDILNETNDQILKLLAPTRQFNALLIDQVERAAAFQLQATRSYVELAFAELRTALDIGCPESLQAYVGRQPAVAETLGKKLSSDAETLTALSKDFSTEVQKLAQENVIAATKFAQPKLVASKPAAPKAAATKPAAKKPAVAKRA